MEEFFTVIIVVFSIIAMLSLWMAFKIKSIKNERNKLYFENNDLKKDIKNHQSELSIYDKEVKKMSGELDAHFKRILDLGNESNSLKNENNALKNNLAKLQNENDELQEDNLSRKNLLKKYSSQVADLKKENEKLQNENDVLKHFSSNTIAFPYMAGIVADFETIGLERMAKSLAWGSNVQREKKVADIRLLRKEAKELIEKYKTAEYQLAYLRNIYPIIDDILETDYEQLPTGKSFDNINEEYDIARNWISKEEYEKLSPTERNQRALDNYIASHRKTNWQIGRDYEMYIGYIYSGCGYSVEYYGIEKGMEDLGRDIIATKGNEVLIIQCKYWSSTKIIHEKHINQLFGTVTEYCFEKGKSQEQVKGILITNTIASDTAKKFSEYLGIQIFENTPLGDYPRIKCNIGHDEYGWQTKIYHLPFDQQYDRTQIKGSGEFYAFTVAEAESKGFRRAFKHYS